MFNGLRYYLWQVLWTKILFVEGFMNSDTICNRFYGLRYYLWQVFRTKILFVVGLMDQDTICVRFYGLNTICGRFNGLK